MPQIPIYQSKATVDQVSFPRPNPDVAALPFQAMGDVAKAQIQAGEMQQRTASHYIELSNRLNELFDANDTSSRLTDAQLELTKAYDEIQQTPEWNSNPKEAQAKANERFKEIVSGKLGGIINPKKRSELEQRLNALYGHFALNLSRDARKKEIEWSRASLFGNLEKLHMAAVNAKDGALFDNALAEAKQLIADHLANGSINPQDAVKLYNTLSKGAAKDFATADLLRDAVGARARAESGTGPYAHLDAAQRETIKDHAGRSIKTEMNEIDRLTRQAEKDANERLITDTVDYLGRLYKGNWDDALKHVLEPDAFLQFNITDPETREKVMTAIDKRATNARQMEERAEKERLKSINMKLAESFINGNLTEERIQASGLSAEQAVKWSNALERRDVKVQKETSRKAVNQAIADILDDKVEDETQLLPILQEHGAEAWSKVTKAYEDRFKLKTGGWWAMADRIWMQKFKDVENSQEERAAFASLLNDAVRTGGLKGDQILKTAKSIMDEQEKSLVEGRLNSLLDWATFGWAGERKTFSDMWSERSTTRRMRDRMIRKPLPQPGEE